MIPTRDAWRRGAAIPPTPTEAEQLAQAERAVVEAVLSIYRRNKARLPRELVAVATEVDLLRTRVRS